MSISNKSALVLSVYILSSALNYIFYLIMAWLLKPSEYGIMGFFLAFFMILSFVVSSGPPQTVIKRVSSGEKPEISLRDGIIANFILGVIIALGFFISIYTITPHKDITTILSITMVFSSIGVVLQNTLLGLFKFKQYALIISLNPVFKILFPTIFVLAGFGVLGVFNGLLIMAALIVAVSIYFIYTANIKFWKAKGSLNFDFFSQSALMLFGTLSIMLLMNIDIIAVKFLSSNNVLTGYYQSAIVLARFPVWITWALMISLFPYISKSSSTELISTSLRYVLAFLVPISIVLAVSPEAYLKLLFPQEYTAASQALRVLACGMAILSLSVALGRGFQALGKEKITAISLTFAVVIQGTLLVLLIPYYGIVGGALATTLASLVAFLIFTVLCGTYLTKETSRVLISYTVLFLVIKMLPMSTRLETVLTTFIVSLVYLLSLFILRIITADDVNSIVSGVVPSENSAVKRLISLIATLNNVVVFRSQK